MELRGKGRRIIFEHIRQLEAAGLLAREARYRANGGRTSSHYTLAWQRPLTPVQNSACPPGAVDRTPPDAESRAAPGAGNRATRTRTKKELDPLPPTGDEISNLGSTDAEQGVTTPRTPRSSRSGRRRDGENPRALEAKASKDHQMRQWALNMHGALDHDEFVEHVESEVAAQKITEDQGRIAVEESERLTSSERWNATGDCI
jgi:hypothetical protein